MIFVKKVILGDMEITFKRTLQIVGCDEYSVFLSDPMKWIGGLTYIRQFSKDWVFVEALTGRNVHFEYRID